MVITGDPDAVETQWAGAGPGHWREVQETEDRTACHGNRGLQLRLLVVVWTRGVFLSVLLVWSSVRVSRYVLITFWIRLYDITLNNAIEREK